MADFLLGYYNGANTFQPGLQRSQYCRQPEPIRFIYFAPYVQDDWKVSSRLTLNLGLRWDYRAVPYEQSNKLFWIDDQNLPGVSGFTGGGLCFADPGACDQRSCASGQRLLPLLRPANPADGSKTPFAPRLVLPGGRSVVDKTVVRGGYGIFWDSSLSREIDDSGDLYPFVTRTPLNPNSHRRRLRRN